MFIVLHRKKMNEAIETESPPAPSRYSGTVVVVTSLVLICILGSLFESRDYFRTYFAGPVATSLHVIEQLPPHQIKNKWVRVRVLHIEHSGWQEVLEERLNESPLPARSEVQYDIKLIPIGKRYLVANVGQDQTSSVLTGALLPMPRETRLLFGQDVPKDRFDRLFLPFILDTTAYSSRSVRGNLVLSLLGLLVCVALLVRQAYLLVRERKDDLQNKAIDGTSQ
jgi:hypothetical protein